MTKAEAERAIRLLVDAYGDDQFRMSEDDADRLAEAIQLLGQPRVFEIAGEQRSAGPTR